MQETCASFTVKQPVVDGDYANIFWTAETADNVYEVCRAVAIRKTDNEAVVRACRTFSREFGNRRRTVSELVPFGYGRDGASCAEPRGPQQRTAR